MPKPAAVKLNVDKREALRSATMSKVEAIGLFLLLCVLGCVVVISHIGMWISARVSEIIFPRSSEKT